MSSQAPNYGCPPRPCPPCNQFNGQPQFNPFYSGYNPTPPVPTPIPLSYFQATYTPAAATALAQGAIVPFSTPQVVIGSGITSNGGGTFTLQPGNYYLTASIATATAGAAFNVVLGGVTYLNSQFVIVNTLISVTVPTTVSVNVATAGGITLTAGATNVISITQLPPSY